MRAPSPALTRLFGELQRKTAPIDRVDGNDDDADEPVRALGLGQPRRRWSGAVVVPAFLGAAQHAPRSMQGGQHS